MKRGQGTFEYVLLLGGVLLIVVLAIVVLQNTAQSSFKGAGQGQCNARLLNAMECKKMINSELKWNACGKLVAADYTQCGQFTAQTAADGTTCALLPATGIEKYCGPQPLGS